MFVEDRVLPIAASDVESVDRYFRQEPVSFRLPIDLPATRQVVMVDRDYTPLIVLGVTLAAFFFGFLAVLVTRRKE